MFTVAQIKTAHSQVKSGEDFPAYIQAIKKLGITAFETWVSDSHTQYFGDADYQTASEPMYEELLIADVYQKEPFEYALKIHQQGKTDYKTFCNDCAINGVEKWFVDLSAMTCTYFDKTGSAVLVEQIPG